MTNLLGSIDSFGDYIALVIMGCLVLNAVVSVMYPLVINFYNISFREEKSCSFYEEFKFSFVNTLDTVKLVLLIDLLAGFMICVLMKLSISGGTSDIIFSMVILVSTLIYSPYLLRSIVDMSKALKMNNNTGDSERLKELEKEINKLKSKM